MQNWPKRRMNNIHARNFWVPSSRTLTLIWVSIWKRGLWEHGWKKRPIKKLTETSMHKEEGAVGVRSTLDAPSPQENKDLRRWRIREIMELECFSVETKRYPKRTRQRASYYMSSYIYCITWGKGEAGMWCAAESQSAKLKRHVRSTAPQYVTCHGIFQMVP